MKLIRSGLKLSIITLSAVVVLSACDITLKKKYIQSPKEFTELDAKQKSQKKYKKLLDHERAQGLTQKDKRLITLYYSDVGNATIIAKAMTLTPISKKEDKALRVSHYLPLHIQVIPLPLELEKLLVKLPRQVLRVQVAKNIILMNVKTRKIIDIIKF